MTEEIFQEILTISQINPLRKTLERIRFFNQYLRKEQLWHNSSHSSLDMSIRKRVEDIPATGDHFPAILQLSILTRVEDRAWLSRKERYPGHRGH